MTNQDHRRINGWVVLGGFCLAAGLLRAQPARTAQNAAMEQEFQAAMSAQDHGDLDKAESMLIALRSKHPGLFAVDESLGLLFVSREKFEAALPILKAAVKDDPSSGIAHANLGADYMKLGKSTDAVNELKIAAKLNPKDKDTQSSLGHALMSSGQPADAAKAFGEAVTLEPQNSDLRYNWAAALLEAGHADQASDALAPIPDQSKMPHVQALLGEIAEKQGRYVDAAEHLQAAARLDPSEQNLYALGYEFMRHWTFEPAIKIFSYGIQRFPNSQRLQLGLGIAEYSMNDLALAAPIFAQLLDTDPESAIYADLLGRSCSLMPEMAKGCEKLEGFAEKHPKNATIATYAAASILHRSNQADDLVVASGLLTQAISLDPKLAEAHFQMGVLEQYQKRWKESIGELETAIELKPEDSKAHYRLAMAYSHTGQRDKAQEEIALQKKYSDLEKDDFNARRKEVKTFLMATP